MKRERDFVDPGDTSELGAGTLPTGPEMYCTFSSETDVPTTFRSLWPKYLNETA